MINRVYQDYQIIWRQIRFQSRHGPGPPSRFVRHTCTIKIDPVTVTLLQLSVPILRCQTRDVIRQNTQSTS